MACQVRRIIGTIVQLIRHATASMEHLVNRLPVLPLLQLLLRRTEWRNLVDSCETFQPELDSRFTSNAIWRLIETGACHSAFIVLPTLFYFDTTSGSKIPVLNRKLTWSSDVTQKNVYDSVVTSLPVKKFQLNRKWHYTERFEKFTCEVTSDSKTPVLNGKWSQRKEKLNDLVVTSLPDWRVHFFLSAWRFNSSMTSRPVGSGETPGGRVKIRRRRDFLNSYS